MPRHRSERSPTHRTRRRDHGFGRVVLARAAERGRAVRAASERALARRAAPARAAGRHGRHGAEGARHATAQRAAAPGRRPADERRVRALLVTPWFAAGAGIVVAALLTLGMPHQQLTFAPPSPPAQQPCGEPRCVTPPRHELGSLATAKPVREIATPAPRRPRQPHARPRPPVPAAPAAPAVHFQLLRDNAQGFIASITILSSRKLGTWSLAFQLPGTRIVRVWGASWHPSASGDGGVATGQAWAVQQPGSGYARFAILGIGPPGRPRGCVFDGARCTFG